MLSVVERIDAIDEAEAIAAQRDFQQLVAFLEAIVSDFLQGDATLRYLLAYGKYMLGQELESLQRLASLKDEMRGRNDRLHRRVLNLNAIIEIELGDLATADRLLVQVQSSAEGAGDTRYLAYATLNQAIAMDIMGFPAQAIAAMQRARASFQRLGDLAAIAGCEHNLGMFSRRIRSFSAAEHHFAAASDYFARHGSPEEAIATAIERSLLLAIVGELELAEAMAVVSLSDAAATDNVRLRAESSRVLGMIRTRQGNLDSANELLNAALEVGRATQLRLLEAEVLMELASLAGRKGDQPGKAALLGEAAAIFTQMGAPHRATELK